MIQQPVKIAISGALGRMGSIFIKEIEKNKNVKLTIALTKNKLDFIGKDIGEIIIGKKNFVKLSNNLESSNKDFDVLIDFTHPSNIKEYLKYCIEHKKKIIIGTTGFNEIEKNIIQEASKKIGIVLSYNFSIGMNVIYKLLKKTTEIIGHDSDIAIIESHHNKKIDIPSGTSLTMKKIIEDNIIIPNEKKIKNQKKITEKTKKIQISSIRIGDVKGDHKVIYSHIGETIEITHKAHNRTIFVNGAIQSAIWLNKKNKGLFSMKDVLEKK